MKPEIPPEISSKKIYGIERDSGKKDAVFFPCQIGMERIPLAPTIGEIKTVYVMRH